MKTKTIGQLKKDLWKVFSAYIRKRDKGRCFTCGRFCEGSGYHAGHFIPKSVGGLALYFDEKNVNGQCYHCNINLCGNQWEYGQRLGNKTVDELMKKKLLSEKWSVNDYNQKISYYKEKLNENE